MVVWSKQGVRALTLHFFSSRYVPFALLPAHENGTIFALPHGASTADGDAHRLVALFHTSPFWHDDKNESPWRQKTNLSHVLGMPWKPLILPASKE
jgi:hypothetical protein